MASIREAQAAKDSADAEFDRLNGSGCTAEELDRADAAAWAAYDALQAARQAGGR